MFRKVILFNCAMIWMLLSGDLLLAQVNINIPFRERPTWVKQLPTGEFFRYFAGSGSSDSSLYYAREEAIYDALGQLLESRAVSGTEIRTYRVYQEIRDMGYSTSVQGFSQEDDYWELTHAPDGDTYHYWILVRYPQPQYVGLDITPLSTKQSYGIAPVIKSLVVPGWGQIHKREYRKATVFLFGYLSAVTLGIISQNISDGYASEYETSRTAIGAVTVEELAEDYHYWSIASFVAAATIYGLNVYDVVKTGDKPLYAISGGSNLSHCYAQVNPAAPQLSLSIYF